MALIVLTSALVGFLIGGVGIGGVLLIPALTYLAPLDPHSAAATALFCFVFSGALGTLLFRRSGNIDYAVALPICFGGVVCSFLGAVVATRINSSVLTSIVALVILGSGLASLIPRPPVATTAVRRPFWTLLLVGAACGFGSGLSGAGGPVFVVPALLLLRFGPLASVGSGQLFQLAAATSGSAANIATDSIEFEWAATVSVPMLASVVVGAYCAHRLPGQWLRSAAALLCIGVSLAMLLA
jgi:uncharacterized membrane protein YfcA